MHGIKCGFPGLNLSNLQLNISKHVAQCALEVSYQWDENCDRYGICHISIVGQNQIELFQVDVRRIRRRKVAYLISSNFLLTEKKRFYTSYWGVVGTFLLLILVSGDQLSLNSIVSLLPGCCLDIDVRDRSENIGWGPGLK